MMSDPKYSVDDLNNASIMPVGLGGYGSFYGMGVSIGFDWSSGSLKGNFSYFNQASALVAGYVSYGMLIDPRGDQVFKQATGGGFGIATPSGLPGVTGAAFVNIDGTKTFQLGGGVRDFYELGGYVSSNTVIKTGVYVRNPTDPGAPDFAYIDYRGYGADKSIPGYNTLNPNYHYSGLVDRSDSLSDYSGFDSPREKLRPSAFNGAASASATSNHRQSEIASMNNLRDYQASQAAASRPRPASEGAQQAQRDAAVSRSRPPSEGAQQAQSDARNKASQQSYAKPGWGLDSPSERRGSGGGSVSSNTKSSSIGGSNSKGSKTSSSGRTSGGLSPTERDERNGNSGSRSASGGRDSKSTNASKASSSSSGSKSSSSKSYSGWDSSGGNKGSNGRMGRVPVFLDLNGNGLTITDTSTSNLFLDIGGDGYKYRTAWVGAGDGVLMIDVDGDGKISDRKEVVFTDWDPSSETDMQALRQVFDTNGNGLLDAGDARWAEFKIMVTNADGTITQRTLAELGIQSINLAVDETKIAFDGGSSIDGQTTFTRTNGTTGLAATVTVAVDTKGYVVTESQSTDASGNKTVVNRAVDKDGQLVSETTRITSADGLSVTSHFDDDGDGVLDRVLTDLTVMNANGSRIQTETMRDGGGILTWSKTTQTSADGKTITIDRDQRGGGYPTERESRVTAANDSLTITIAQLAQNGAIISQVSNVMGSDRLTRTVNIDADGNGIFEQRTEHQTVRNADGSRVERDSVMSGSGLLQSRKETSIAASNLSRTETSDLDGDGAVDVMVTSSTNRNSSGDTTVVENSMSGDATVFARTTTTISSDGLRKTVLQDVDGDGLTDRESTDLTVVAADQSKTRTITTKSASGLLLAHSVEQRAADGLVGSIATDANGDGANDLVVAVAKDLTGVVTETATANSADGSLISCNVKSTSADGLTTTTQMDRFGRGAFDMTVVDVVTRNADGSATQTVETRTEDQTLIDRTTQLTSANGLSIAQSVDMTGDGVIDRRSNSTTTLNADGSQMIVEEERSGDGTLLSGDTTVISTDRRMIVVSSDTDGDGHLDLVESISVSADGAQSVETRELSNTGTLLSRTVVMTSANNLTVTRTVDVDGDGDADSINSDVTSVPINGQVVRTVSSRAQNGALLATETTKNSLNGMVSSIERDLNGDGVIEESETKTTSFDTDGSRITSATRKAGATTVATSLTRTAANGLGWKSTLDVDGNGTIDTQTQWTKTLSIDGAVSEDTTTRNANNILLNRKTTTTSANGMSVVTVLDENGDTVVDRRSEQTLDVSGRQTVTVTEFDAFNSVISRAVTTTERGGLAVTQTLDKNGDGTTDLTRTSVKSIDTNGTVTTISSEYQGSSSLTERTTATQSANGLSTSVVYTDGSLATLRAIQDTLDIRQDGSTRAIRHITKADGSTESRTVVDTSASKRTTVTSRDIDGDGVADQIITTSLADTGVYSEVSVDLGTDGETVARRTRLEISADGLVRTYSYDGNGDGTADSEVRETTALEADGSRSVTSVFKASVGGSWVVRGKEQITISGNGLQTISRWNDSGDAGWTLQKTDTTVLNADGSVTATELWQKGAQVTRRTEQSTSANELTVTTRVDVDGNGTFDQQKTDVTTLNADGTTTRTITASGPAGANLSTVTQSTSVDGRTVTIVDTSAIAGVAPRTTTIVKRQLADGSSLETETVRNASNQVIERVETEISADKRRVTLNRDRNGDGVIDQREEVLKTVDGRTITTVTNFSSADQVASKTTSVTSADGLTQTTEIDKNGDGLIDTRRTQTNAFNADGSKETLTSDLDTKTGKLRSASMTRTSADGRTFVEETDVDGDGLSDQVMTETALPSGARVTTLTNNTAARANSNMKFGEIYWSSAIPAASETVSDPNGATKVTRVDQDGDGYFELTLATETMVDGSVSTQITETNTNGTIKGKGTYRVSHDGVTSILSKDADNNGVIEFTETAVSKADGSVTKTAVTRSAAGAVVQTQTTDVDALGNILKSVTLDGANKKIAEHTKLADGTSLRRTFVAATGSVLSSEVWDDYNVIRSVVVYDRNSAYGWSRVESHFNASGLKTNSVQYLDSGTAAHFQIYTNGVLTSNLANLVFTANRITGGTGNDLLIGTAASETITGGAGNDVLDAGGAPLGSRSQSLVGGAGNDVYVYRQASGNVSIGSSAETASSGVDVMVFPDLSLSDLIFEANGPIPGIPVGGPIIARNLKLSWKKGDLEGSVILYNTGSYIERFEFADGTTLQHISGTSMTLTGRDVADKITGTAGSETILGNGGNDIINGGGGADTLVGGAGDDRIEIDKYDISYSGGAGIDTLVFTGDGALEYSLAQGEFENVQAGFGNDRIYGTDAANTMNLGAGDDFVQGFGGNDTITGGYGADILMGMDGDDRIIIDQYDTWFSGDAGIDTLVFTGLGALNYSLAQGEFENVEAGAGDDIVYGTDDANVISLGSGNDHAQGFGGNDTITGGDGDDELQGMDGNDYLIGGAGNDTLIGGAGVDRFQLGNIVGIDTLVDFSPSLGDVIEFDRASFGIASTAAIATHLVFGATAPNATRGYFLVTSSGISWDADGSGAGAAKQLAAFASPVTGMTASNFAFK